MRRYFLPARRTGTRRVMPHLTRKYVGVPVHRTISKHYCARRKSALPAATLQQTRTFTVRKYELPRLDNVDGRELVRRRFFRPRANSGDYRRRSSRGPSPQDRKINIPGITGATRAINRGARPELDRRNRADDSPKRGKLREGLPAGATWERAASRRPVYLGARQMPLSIGMRGPGDAIYGHANARRSS